MILGSGRYPQSLSGRELCLNRHLVMASSPLGHRCVASAQQSPSVRFCFLISKAKPWQIEVPGLASSDMVSARLSPLLSLTFSTTNSSHGALDGAELSGDRTPGQELRFLSVRLQAHCSVTLLNAAAAAAIQKSPLGCARCPTSASETWVSEREMSGGHRRGGEEDVKVS